MWGRCVPYVFFFLRAIPRCLSTRRQFQHLSNVFDQPHPLPIKHLDRDEIQRRTPSDLRTELLTAVSRTNGPGLQFPVSLPPLRPPTYAETLLRVLFKYPVLV